MGRIFKRQNVKLTRGSDFDAFDLGRKGTKEANLQRAGFGRLGSYLYSKEAILVILTVGEDKNADLARPP
jgi:hypothetical protein